MDSLVKRVFHKILAACLTRLVPLDPRQIAFRLVDGCVDNLFLLDTIILWLGHSEGWGFQNRWWNTLVTCMTTHLLFSK